MKFEPTIGLEVHAELETKSKMFCACPVVDVTRAEPNMAVCAVCAGMPGTLPVLNRRAVEFAVRVALALECQVSPVSIFARKNYFYPDLPKGYQISQYEQPLARDGKITIHTSQGEKNIRIRRVHLEEDTGKLTHVSAKEAGSQAAGEHTLVDLNRAGIPLLEIVTEPDFHSAEEVRAYASALRSLLRYLQVNSGDMQKGVLRIEPNVSVSPAGSGRLGTRVEIKNLNSLRALERSVEYEIRRQSALIGQGKPVRQQTVGWSEERQETFLQRVKEAEDDYRYFPEPDLPPLVVEAAWLEEIRARLPELPQARLKRFVEQYGLSLYDAGVLVAEKTTADFYEKTLEAAPEAAPKVVANWVSGELFSLINQAGSSFEQMRVSPQAFGNLVQRVAQGQINNTTAKTVLSDMFLTGRNPGDIIREGGFQQITDPDTIRELVSRVLADHPDQAAAYRVGRDSVLGWLIGQVMRRVRGQANAQLVHQELERQLNKSSDSDRENY